MDTKKRPRAAPAMAGISQPEDTDELRRMMAQMEHLAATRMASIFAGAYPDAKLSSPAFRIALEESENYVIVVPPLPGGYYYRRLRDVSVREQKVCAMHEFGGVAGFAIQESLKADDPVTIVLFDSRQMALCEKGNDSGDAMPFHTQKLPYHRYRM